MTVAFMVFLILLISPLARALLLGVAYLLLARVPLLVYAVVFICCVLATGCTTAPVAPSPTLVAVPVQCPAPNVPPRPVLALETMSAPATCEDTIYVYAESLRTCIGYSNQLQTILKAYQ